MSKNMLKMLFQQDNLIYIKVHPIPICSYKKFMIIMKYLKLKQMIYRNSYMMPEIDVIDVTVENDFCGSPVNASLTFSTDMQFGDLEEEN